MRFRRAFFIRMYPEEVYAVSKFLEQIDDPDAQNLAEYFEKLFSAYSGGFLVEEDDCNAD